MILAN